MASIGWGMTEVTGVSVVNPRAVSKMINQNRILSRSIPGFRHLLSVYYTTTASFGPSQVQPAIIMKLEIGNKAEYICRYSDSGLEWNGENKPAAIYRTEDPGRSLCSRVWSLLSPQDRSEIPIDQVIDDGYWSRFLDELPDLWTTARVMMT